MKSFKPWLVILLVFAAGFAGGVVVTRATVRHILNRTINRPDTVRDMMEQRMVRRLELNAEQRDQVHKILVERQGELRELRVEFEPKFLQIVTNADSEISTILTPEQREKFEKLREENRQLWPRRGGGIGRRHE